MAKNDSPEENIHQFIHNIGSLKRKSRAGWVKHKVDRPESVAEHNFRMAVMALVLSKKLGLDQNKCVKMALVHDIPEYKTPDYTPFDKVTKEEKFRQEGKAMKELCGKIEDGDEVFDLWNEYRERKTPEAKFVKQLDKLEMMFQAEEYAREQPDKDLELFWEMQDDFDFGELAGIFELLKTKRITTPRKS